MNNGLQQARKVYRRNQLAGMQPLERLLLTYTIAIEAANEGDGPRLERALMILRSALRFDEHPQVALGFLRLYRHCERAVREHGAYHEAVQILTGLKRAFEMSEVRMRPEDAL